MDINNNIDFLLRRILHNKVLFKNVIVYIKDLNWRYLVGTNHLVYISRGHQYGMGYHSMLSLSLSFKMMDNAEWILKNNFIDALFYKLKLSHDFYYVEHRLTWSKAAFALAAQKIRDEKRIEYLVDCITDHTMALEASVRNGNLVFFQKLCIAGSKKLIKEPQIMVNLLNIAVECGFPDIMDFIATKYTPALKNEDNFLFVKALESKNTLTLMVLVRSRYFKAVSPLPLWKLLLTHDIAVVKHFFDPLILNVFEPTIDQYILTLIVMPEFGWNHFEVLSYLLKRKYNNNSTFSDSAKSIVYTENWASKHKLTDNQVAYCAFVMMLRNLTSPHIKSTLKTIVSFNSKSLIDSMIDLYVYGAKNLGDNLISYIIESGNIDMINTYKAFWPKILPTVLKVSSLDTLEILQFIHQEYPATIVGQQVLWEQAKRKDGAPNVKYMISNIPSISVETNLISNALSNGQMDVVYLGPTYGFNLLQNHEYLNTCLNFKKLFSVYGKDNLSLNPRHLESMVLLNLREEFDLAVKAYGYRIDPVIFIYIGDFEWMVEAIKNNKCLPKTDDTEHYTHYALQREIGLSGSIQLYRMYDHISGTKNGQWKKRVTEEASKYNHAKLIKAIQLNIDEY